MSIASEITRLQTAKANIKSAIEAKGVTVGNVTLDLYPSKIALISSASGNDDDMSDINKVYYIDHTGHVHYSYTLEEFLALLSAPANPSFTGLTPTGWQMSLSAAQAFVRANGFGPIIGQTYTTNDGTTRVYVNIDDDRFLSFRVGYAGLSNANKTKLKIDWGDNTEMSLSSNTSGTVSHTYALLGLYIIKYIPEDNTVSYIPGSITSAYPNIFCYYHQNPSLYLLPLITKIEFGGNVSGYLTDLNITRCESISVPYGCTIRIINGIGPRYVFNTYSLGSTPFNVIGSYSCSELRTTIVPEGCLKTSNFSLSRYLSRVVMPSTLTAFPLFSSCTYLLAVNIPSGITSLANDTFSWCSHLKKVSIPNTTTTLGSSVFSNCHSLEEITMSTAVTSMGNYCFSNCYKLKSIQLPNTLSTLGTYCFLNCYSLSQKITIPSGVIVIPTLCFISCTFLPEVVLPNTVTEIKDSAFSECRYLRTINFPSSLTTFGTSSFANCHKLEGTITIPSGTTTIPNTCFQNCYKITKVIIPSSVTSIGTNAFLYCYSLKEIKFSQTNSSLVTIGLNAFYNCFNLSGVINIPEGVTTISAAAFLLSIYGYTELIIPSTVTSIGNLAFDGQYSSNPEAISDKVVHVKATVPPTAGTTIFGALNTKANKLTIYVPAASVDTYKAATNWKTYKDLIFAEPTV